MTTQALDRTTLQGLPLLRRGKVRDLYAVGDDLLLVTTDRISAYDVVMPTPIPDRGRVLTSLSLFWFRRFVATIPHHVITEIVAEMPAVLAPHATLLQGRAVLAKRLDMVPVECVVRGYLMGSAWRAYREEGSVCGVALPSGLSLGSRLDPPIFTPTTKADQGHDLPLTFSEVEDRLGREAAGEIRDRSLDLYQAAHEFAWRHGLLIADTKFEFGRDGRGVLTLADEALTPDSSRFWEASAWQPGRAPESLDKQVLRDWLDQTGWDRTAPAPALSAEVVTRLQDTYRTIYRRLTGEEVSS